MSYSITSYKSINKCEIHGANNGICYACKAGKKHLVKNGRFIVGFVGMNSGKYFYSFGKPSQSEYIAFQCEDLNSGINFIKEHSNLIT